MRDETRDLIKPGDYVKYGSVTRPGRMRVTHVEGDIVVGRTITGYPASTTKGEVWAIATGFAPVNVADDGFDALSLALAESPQFVAVRWDNGVRSYVEVDEALLWEEESITNADR